MILNKNMTKEEFTKAVIEEVNNGKASVGQKIQTLVKIRRESHGNDVIQDKCNEYLTKLYNKKYEMLDKGEQI